MDGGIEGQLNGGRVGWRDKWRHVSTVGSRIAWRQLEAGMHGEKDKAMGLQLDEGMGDDMNGECVDG